MPKIKLTQGFEAIVDPLDFIELSQYSWHILKARNLIYAARTLDKKNYPLHHAVAKNMGLEIGDCVIGFHNGNGLDCRRENLYLRNKNIRLNCHKAYTKKSGKSGYRGVQKTSSGKYKAYFGRKYLGTYTSPIEAANVYNQAAIDKYGDEAILNFVV